MKVAIPVWNQRVSPVFDAARTVIVSNVVNGIETGRIEEQIFETDIFHRVERIMRLDANVLICGAISKPLENELIQRGIEVISQICGEVDRVLNAFCSGEILQDHYAMPGCCQKRRMRRRCRGESRERRGNVK